MGVHGSKLASMTAALFGLTGVLLGALLTVILQYLLGVRNEYAAATVAARLIIVELNGLVVVVERGTFNDSGSLETPAWDKQQAALAIVLPTKHWEAVERAYTTFAAESISMARLVLCPPRGSSWIQPRSK